MKLRVISVVQQGLSTKVLASVATALVTAAAAYLASRNIHLGKAGETALTGVVTALLVGLVGYAVPEKTS